MKKLKNWIATVVIRRMLRRAWRSLPEQERQTMLEMLRGKKELITHALGFLTVLLTTFGATDFIPPFQKVSDAIAAGEPTAILTAVIGLGLFAAGWFGRLGKNRQHAEVTGKA